MGLRDIGATLPPGFRFYPSDEELVCHYLHKKISNEDVVKGTLVEIDLHTCEPWQLPVMNIPICDYIQLLDSLQEVFVMDCFIEVAKLNSSEWYFFSFRDRKYATGYRTNRATISGYWKATGKDRTVVDPKSRAVVGMRKTLVFYKNRAPNGIKTGWIMHEFRLENPHIPPKEDWVLCRVFYKGKGDNSNEFSPHNTAENYTTSDTSPNLATSPPATYQTFPCVYLHHHQQNQNPTNFLQHKPNFLQISRGGGGVANEATVNEMIVNSKSEDQYGFLFEMGFDHEHSFGDGLPLEVEDMRFNDGDDNGLVFL